MKFIRIRMATNMQPSLSLNSLNIRGIKAAILGSGYLYVLMGAVFTTAIGFSLLKLVQSKFGQSEFESYLLLLRYSGFLSSTLLLGMGVSVPRFLGLYSKNKRVEHGSSVIFTGLVTVLVTSSLMFVLLQFDAIAGRVDILLFGGLKNSRLLVLYATAISFFGLSYSVMRGLEQFEKIEIMRIVGIGLPSLAMVIIMSDYRYFIFSVAFLYGAAAIWVFCTKLSLRRVVFKKDVFGFGARRVLGDIIYPALTAFPVVTATQMLGRSVAAELSFYLMILGGAMLLSNPVSTVLLPKAISLSQSKEYLKIHLFCSILGGAIIFVIYMGLISILSPFFLNGTNWTIAVNVGIASFFLTLYVAGRSVIDGAYNNALIFRYLFYSLCVEVLLLFVVHEISGGIANIVFSFLFGAAALGIQVFIKINAMYKKCLDDS